MRQEGLLIVKRKKYAVTTNSKHWMRKYPFRVRGVALIRPEQVWVADITYLNAGNSNGYFQLITDAYPKQIMGYELCNNLEATYTIKALQMALKKRNTKINH